MQTIPIVLLGHQDHGKSTLIGRLLFETKSVKESRLQEVQEVDESAGQTFELAHLMDSFKEERERGMTIDTTRAVVKGKVRGYQLIDVPGHGELIANMLTGAAGAEAALLIVSIEEGIKEQTRQHLEIAKLLGIDQLGVVLNKIDMVDYREERVVELVEKLKRILGEIGYIPGSIHFFPVSAKLGENVVEKSTKTPWYQGYTVMEFLENEVRMPESFKNLPGSFLVQDRYENFLVGKVETGILKNRQEVVILPDKKKCAILTIKDSEGELQEAEAGWNVGIEISSEIAGSPRGTVIAALHSNLNVGINITGEIFWIEQPSQKTLDVECGTVLVRANLRKPEKIKRGEKTFYEMSLDKPIVYEPRGKTILGKFVLKERGEIIAVGTIV